MTTRKCPICGKLYKFYMHYAGDQSKCSGCRKAEREALQREDTPEQVRRRNAYFR